MNNSIPGNEDQNAQSQQAAQPAHEKEAQTGDSRQEAIAHEQDTARLRSERKSVEDGSGQQPKN